VASAECTKSEIARGEALFKSPCTFVKGVVKIDGLPQDGRHEVAFAGRSNVGKSSLINALTGRKSLARVSVTPGRTRELNFFTLGKDAEFHLVDMPGYGYARAAKSEIKGWTRLIRDYLKGRRELKRVFLLIDGRHGIKANDRESSDQGRQTEGAGTRRDRSRGRGRAGKAPGGLSGHHRHLGADGRRIAGASRRCRRGVTEG
jgi:GTP-binding protein